VCRYSWHSAGSPGLKYKYIFHKIYGSDFIKQHSETVTVSNVEIKKIVDCIKEINLSCYLLSFSARFRSLLPSECRRFVPTAGRPTAADAAVAR